MTNPLARNLLAAFLSMISLLANAENRFTGTYMTDAHPHKMIYLALTQTQDSVAGAMTIVTPNHKGGVDSQTVPLRGTSDGNSISLIAEQFLNNLAITGQKKGRTIALTFPSASGDLATLSFAPASENDFNAAVIKWRQSLFAMHSNQERLKARQINEHQKLEKLARSFYDNVRAIKGTGISDDLIQAKSALQNERLALKEIEEGLAQLKRDTSLRPMTCHQAYQTVGYDFQQTMEFSYKQTLGHANSQFQSAVIRLEKRLSHVDSMTEQIRKNASELQEAIRISKFPPPRLSISPGEEIAPLEQYQTLARLSKEEVPALKTQNEELLNKAKEIMREGKDVMETAQSLVRCR
jgi:hypothetical protein